MKFAKVGRTIKAAQLETAATRIVQAANACWIILGIIVASMVVTTASYAQANEIVPLQLLQAWTKKAAVSFLQGKITRPLKYLT